MRIYLDASPVIYLVEKVAPYAATLLTRLSAAGVVLVASELTRLEVLVKPLKKGDAALQTDFEAFFTTQVSELIPFTRPVFDRALQIRADHGFKTPDALHLAAAVEGACNLFLTNDAQLKAFPDLTVEVI
jgi:predicted nucleic acid-binding protein